MLSLGLAPSGVLGSTNAVCGTLCPTPFFVSEHLAQCDEHNMQYDRGNNLLLGDLPSNSLKELSGHRILRPSAGITSDHHLYMSVSVVQWFGNKLYMV
jgi:hypothetical protein